MFQKIDAWLFDKVFQPFADWFFDTYGKNTFWLAGTMCWFLLTIAILHKALYPHEATLPYEWVIDWIFDLFWGFYCLYTAVRFDKKSKRKRWTQRNAARILPNCVLMRQLCMIFLFFFTSGILWAESINESLLAVLFFTVFTSIQYFSACDTKPPAPPKKQSELKPAYAN